MSINDTSWTYNSFTHLVYLNLLYYLSHSNKYKSFTNFDFQECLFVCFDYFLTGLQFKNNHTISWLCFYHLDLIQASLLIKTFKLFKQQPTIILTRLNSISDQMLTFDFWPIHSYAIAWPFIIIFFIAMFNCFSNFEVIK